MIPVPNPGLAATSNGVARAPTRKPYDIPCDRRVCHSVVDYMAESHSVTLSLADLSRFCGYTPTQLIRCFNNTLGISPHACLTQIRLHMACRLLLLGERIADIAASVGFYDQSPLNKHFKAQGRSRRLL